MPTPTSDSTTPMRTDEVRMSDGVPLFVREWKPEQVRGAILMLHGIQSHSGWYPWSCGRVADAGWHVRMIDRRGSGQSGGLRGHADHPDRLVSDVVSCLQSLRREHRDANIPVVLLGLSWGGKLAAAVAARRPELVDGLVLLYPGILTRIRPKVHQKAGLKAALAAGLTTRTNPIPLDDPALFTGDPEWQEFIANDDLSLREATLGFFGTSAALDGEMRTTPERLSGPVLLTLAGRDRIVHNPRMRAWFDRIPSDETTVVEYPTAAHTLEFDPIRERWMHDFTAWLGWLADSR